MSRLGKPYLKYINAVAQRVQTTERENLRGEIQCFWC
jgi:hypothetical protein